MSFHRAGNVMTPSAAVSRGTERRQAFAFLSIFRCSAFAFSLVPGPSTVPPYGGMILFTPHAVPVQGSGFTYLDPVSGFSLGLEAKYLSPIHRSLAFVCRPSSNLGSGQGSSKRLPRAHVAWPWLNPPYQRNYVFWPRMSWAGQNDRLNDKRYIIRPLPVQLS